MNVIVPKTVSEYETQINVSTKAGNIVKKLMTITEQETLAAIDKAHDMNFDAIILYTLFKSYGFSAEKLKAFFDEVRAISKAEGEADAYRANYGEIPQRAALKDEAGIDLKIWYEEAE